MRRFLICLMLAQACFASASTDWSALERYQQTISRAEFDTLLSRVYCPSGGITNCLAYGTNSVAVYSTSAKTNPSLFVLQFASQTRPFVQHRPTFHRIALDPGHIGGEWARMEERFFVHGKDRPIQEAVLNLAVARLLKARLEAAGA